MFHYISFLWNEDHPDQAETVEILKRRLNDDRHKWKCVLDRDGLSVFCIGENSRFMRCHYLHGKIGVVLGAIFNRPNDLDDSTSPKAAIFGAQESEDILNTGGKVITSLYWGNYVSLIHNVQTRQKWILRGPMSSLPCLHTKYGDVCICGSDLETIARLGLRSLSIDWEMLITYFISMPETTRTCFKEITSVVRGQCITLAGDRLSSSLYWDPTSFISRNIVDPQQAILSLRRNVMFSVRAWASCFDDALVLLSGGLDSSILTACLKKVGIRAVCANQYWPKNSVEDERPFAAAMARKTGYELIEIERNYAGSGDYREALNARRSAVPVEYSRCVTMSQSEFDLCHKFHLGAIFTGSGGDEVFFRHAQKYEALDYAYFNKLSYQLLYLALSSAVSDGTTFWNVLFRALFAGSSSWKKAELGDTFARQPLLNPQWVVELQRNGTCEPLWCQSKKELPPGKATQIFRSLAPSTYGNLLIDINQVPRLDPFRSQPLLEFVLGLSTELFSFGDMERGLIRHAFEPELPPEVFGRISKGGMTDFQLAALIKNKAFVRELVLDSPLVKNRIVVSKTFEQALFDVPSTAVNVVSDLTKVFNVALWLELWNSGDLPIAA